MESTRKPAVAGLFYPKEKSSLKNIINNLLQDIKEEPFSIRALVVPHAGYSYSGSIAAAGYKILKNPDVLNVIIIGPSHFARFDGCALTPSREWETPLGISKINSSYFSGSPIMKEMEAPHRKEHSIEVQIPFIQMVLPTARLVPVLTGTISPKQLSIELDSRLTENDLLVVSTDLSHYYPYEEAIHLDGLTNRAVEKLNPEGVIEACGLTGLLSLLHLAKKRKWSPRILAYANSGDTAGDKSNVVGYGCYAFC